MADGMGGDFSDVLRLAVQFEAVEGEIPRGIEAAAKVSAFGVKKSWKHSLAGSEVPAAGSTIQYEVNATADSVEAVISANRGSDRLRGFVRAREYGSPTVSPGQDAQRALEANAADFESGLGIAAERAIERALRT